MTYLIQPPPDQMSDNTIYVGVMSNFYFNLPKVKPSSGLSNGLLFLSVLQAKMSSAPALNYSGIRNSFSLLSSVPGSVAVL